MKKLALAVAAALCACGPSVKSVTVEPASVSIQQKGASAKLSATPKDDKGLPVNDPSLKATWTSSDASVASVDGTGKVTANKSGDAVVTATVGEVKGTAKVSVSVPALVDVEPK